MRVSVVLPNYNHGHLLRRALDAVLNQSVTPQVVVVDDGSTDNSRDVLREYEGWVELIPLPQNKGVVNAVNIGLDWARGDWVAVLAADDYVLPGFFERALAQADKHPNIGIVAGRAEWEDEASGKVIVVGERRAGYYPPREALRKVAPTQAVLYRRSLNLRLDPATGPYSDWLMNMEASLYGGMACTGTVDARGLLAPAGYFQSTDKLACARRVVERLEELGVTERAPLHLLGWAGWPLLPEHLRTPERWAQFAWHAVKARAWRRLPRWALKAWARIGWRAL